ncbi:MAG TPA: cytochrome d ubiquinol oxidase subunit II [Acidimicrobiales bacterium]|nr:cytochrome d ubiquinol oxidase subunit II [Acidimicrobiales bacterium]
MAAAILFGVVVLYAVFGGADFGAGFWDLTAGGIDRGQAPRELIDAAIGPVWEANHVWLIFCLVVLWTSFSSAFAAITRTLYIPLGLAALGIVLRGSGFAFRKVAISTTGRRVEGLVFAASSIITPFFMGAVAGAIASGRVPGNGVSHHPLSSWLSPTSILGGVMAVVTCAYLAAVFLTAEAGANQAHDLETYFRRRAIGAAIGAGAIAVVGIFILHADAPRLFRHLVGVGAPLVAVSGLAGLAALILLGRGDPSRARVVAALAVGTIVLGWGVAQYPNLLGTHTPISQAAAPSGTLWAVCVVAVAATVLCVPSLAFLFYLQQHRELEAT